MAINLVDEMKYLPIDLKNLQGFHLIPAKEYKIIKSETEAKYSILVHLIYDNQLVQSAILLPGDIYEYDKIPYKFGEKNLSKIGKNDFGKIVKEYNELILHIKTIEIYGVTGWITDEKFLLNNLLIYKNFIRRVELLNEIYSTDLDISQLKQVDEDFISIIIGIFYDRVLSEIFLVYKFLSFIISRLPQNSNSFSTLLAVIGTTGSKKTSTVNAFFNPLGKLSIQSSFEDTRASVEETFRNCNDNILIVDDMSKNNNKQTEILEKVLRLVSDKTTGGKKMRRSKILNNPNKVLAIVTGELLPELPISSLASTSDI